MDWRDKTTMERAVRDEFDTALAHVTVADRGVRVAFKDVRDWKRIDREVGDDVVLREAYWDEVADIDATTEHLYYMHIDLEVETEDGETVERRIYFLEDEDEVLDDCLKALRRAWSGFRQRHASPGGTYSYAAVDATEEEVELEDPDGQIRVEEPAAAEAEETHDGAAVAEETHDGAAVAEETHDGAAVAEAKKLVQKARDKMHGATERAEKQLAGEDAAEAEEDGTDEDEAEQEGGDADESGEDADEEGRAEDDVEDIVDDFLRD